MIESERPRELVEHFFRHEYANLVAVLTRIFGVQRIELVEDQVSAAMAEAMSAWKQGGIPDNPAAWMHRVARNRILDKLRREKTHDTALAFATQRLDSVAGSGVELIDDWLDGASLPDSLLRMMFVCCHPELDRGSQVALTLKILCGFSVNEISRGLLISSEAAKKRIQRARGVLAEKNVTLEMPNGSELRERLSVVHDVLYLMFNEGYSTSQGAEPIRDDVCEDAARLCHMLCTSEELSTPESCALLALMLFHAARLPSRTDSVGNVVLLEDQDRSQWDGKLIEAANRWLIRSVKDVPSRFHLEAVIAQCHCAAASFGETDWHCILLFYDRLLQRFPSPVYQLNRAIALAHAGDCKRAFKALTLLRASKGLTDYFLLDCAEGHIHALVGDTDRATDYFLAALSGPIAEHQRAVIRRRLELLRE